MVDLWDKCLVFQYERDEFFESLQKIESSDEVYELLSQEVFFLQELSIDKMIEFEERAYVATFKVHSDY
ncbi:hypothetical protein Glove_79g31 [Diversispora epigaea]|uniref:Uncharacterized protein n=1 Tax=Diversispora epigaea TaxID=1348612 RepID=A0A397JJB7_9GLOM|nr:hypothetical protein Glove_79g31 [Diversispora epigaea]